VGQSLAKSDPAGTSLKIVAFPPPIFERRQGFLMTATWNARDCRAKAGICQVNECCLLNLMLGRGLWDVSEELSHGFARMKHGF
jgi:hypothetical protein